MLLNGLPPGVEVIRISSSEEGISQIAASLEGRSGIDAIHIISHGSSGQLQLGATSLTSSNLGSYSSQLAAIGSRPKTTSLAEMCQLLLVQRTAQQHAKSRVVAQENRLLQQ